MPDRVAQSVARLTQELEVLVLIPGLATYFRSPSADSRGTFDSYWRKYVHEILVNRLGVQVCPEKSVVRLAYCPDKTIHAKQQNNNKFGNCT